MSDGPADSTAPYLVAVLLVGTVGVLGIAWALDLL
jgi:hypothetical protein